MEPESYRFLTFGNKHLRLWQQNGTGSTYQSTQLSFGKLKMQSVHSAVFLDPEDCQEVGSIVAGMASGEIYIFKVIEGLRFLSPLSHSICSM